MFGLKRPPRLSSALHQNRRRPWGCIILIWFSMSDVYVCCQKAEVRVSCQMVEVQQEGKTSSIHLELVGRQETEISNAPSKAWEQRSKEAKSAGWLQSWQAVVYY